MRRTLWAVLALAWAAPARAEEPPAWAGPMKAVHAKFTGKPGTLALFGDSITVSKAFWSPLSYAPKDLPDPLGKNVALVKKHMIDDCWSKWRGAEYGSDGGKTIKWADVNVGKWLEKLNPEAAVVMFGTNDLNQLDAKEYEAGTRSVVEKCLKNGTVAILTTIPPRAGQEKKAAQFAEIARKVAADLKVPLIDYHAEILRLRPDDWNGAQPKFKDDAAKDVYQVPTLVSGDGVHPSNPSKFQDYCADSLKKNGYQLRSVLTVNAYADVIREVLAAKK
jgi:hypothetical protein